jgi:hypothetical protein
MDEPVGDSAQDSGDDLAALAADVRVVEDWLALMKGEELPDDRATVYIDAVDDHRHGTALTALIRHYQETGDG